MKNLNISTRILLLVLLPLAGLVFFAAKTTIENVQHWRSLSMTTSLMEVATTMGALNHDFQVERGATAGYIQSKGARFADVLPGYQKATDGKLEELKDLYAKTGSAMPPNIRSKIGAALAATNGLGDIRRQASGFSVPAAEAAKYFTQTIAVILASLPAIAEQSADLDVAMQMTGYIAFLNAKERAGQERALMVPVFTADKIEPVQYRAFLGHGVAQQAYLAMFSGYANASLLEFFKQKESGETFATVNTMRDAVVSKASEGGFGIEPTQWFRAITAKIDTMRGVEDMAASQIKSSAAERSSQAFSALLMQSGISIIVLLVTMALGYWIARSITHPLHKLKTAISDIQQSNDLTRCLDVESKDELGQTAEAFNQLIESLRASMNQVVEGANTVLQLSGQVAAASTQVAASSQTQSDAASAMAASVEEMTVSINQISDHAREAQEISGNSNELSNRGSEVILKVVRDMKSIAENVHQSSMIIQELGQQSDQIHSIVQVIKEIADQTNLLALNAAIEAARAGEQGRGFAVVADEVRKLAERTTRSTEEIAGMIGKIQDGAKHAVASMDVGVNCVNQGVVLAGQAGDAIHQIQSGSRQVSVAITDISSAIKEQSAASNEIAQHVEKVAQMSDENTAAIQSSSAIAQDLQNLATDLKNTVAKFRI